MQQESLFGDSSGALFSPCMGYRYRLWRIWDGTKPACAFLMLNPSTADATKLDPTCTRARNFASAWGYGSLQVINLFAYRATRPSDMKRVSDPVGPRNDAEILDVAKNAGIIICAWGSDGLYQERASQVVTMLRGAGIKLCCLQKTRDGQPGHPLYLKSNLTPVSFDI